MLESCIGKAKRKKPMQCGKRQVSNDCSSKKRSLTKNTHFGKMPTGRENDNTDDVPEWFKGSGCNPDIRGFESHRRLRGNKVTKREAEQIIKKSYEQGLVEWSGDAIAKGYDPYWVSVENIG